MTLTQPHLKTHPDHWLHPTVMTLNVKWQHSIWITMAMCNMTRCCQLCYMTECNNMLFPRSCHSACTKIMTMSDCHFCVTGYKLLWWLTTGYDRFHDIARFSHSSDRLSVSIILSIIFLHKHTHHLISNQSLCAGTITHYNTYEKIPLEWICVDYCEQMWASVPAHNTYLLQHVWGLNCPSHRWLGCLQYLPTHHEFIQNEVGLLKVKNDVQLTHLKRKSI